MLLRSAGFETREASCGESALAQVETLRGRLDVLIVDYNLGRGMTGTEVAEEFARLLGHAVPTVMLTGDPANAEVPWLAEAPVWVARKPLLPGNLVSRAAAAGGIPPRGRGRLAALVTAAPASVPLGVQRQHARQILLDVFDAFLRRRMRAQELRRAASALAHWPSCSTA